MYACFTCWRKSWERKKRLECFACREEASPEDEREMRLFMGKINAELTMKECDACEKTLPETCIRKLLAC